MKYKQKNNFFESLSEFDNHNSVVFVYDEKTKLRGYIAFHKGGFYIPSFGATRFLNYRNGTDAVRDALRLSKLMSYKNALAGLSYGGAKAVLIEPKGKYSKNALLKEYARHIEKLGGSFITGTDVGITLKELKLMMTKTKNMVGVVNNPEKATALGVVYSMEAAAKNIKNKKSIVGMSFAIQGVGKVGKEILSIIYKRASKIYISDINTKTLRKVKKQFPRVAVLSPEKIHKQNVDIFCPCALSNVLNSESINQIRAKAVIGSANNQLKSIEIGETLHRLGILYCPDYVVNAGGLIAVADEYEHKKPNKARLNKKLQGIGKRVEKILSLSKTSKKPPVIIADEMANRILKNFR